MKDRIELTKYFAEMGFKRGAEIGVCDGVFSEYIYKANPGVMLFCIDTWEPYKGYTDYKKISTFTKMYEDAKKRLEPYGCILIKKYSMDAVKDFEDESLDFVYIDANHTYPYVKEDIREWTKKVRKGGIVSGHDYCTIEGVGVKQAVDEYVEKHGYKLKVTSESNRKRPSWYFVINKKVT